MYLKINIYIHSNDLPLFNVIMSVLPEPKSNRYYHGLQIKGRDSDSVHCVQMSSAQSCTVHKLTVRITSPALSLGHCLFPSVPSHISGPWIIYRTNKTQFCAGTLRSFVKFRQVMSWRKSKKSWSDTSPEYSFWSCIFCRTGISLVTSILLSLLVFHWK